MNNKTIKISASLAIICLSLCQIVMAAPAGSPLQPVQHVELKRYVGLWYDIAHYPNKYQEGCQDSIVRFSIRDNGEIDVLNSCRDKQKGDLHHADGHGWVTDNSSNALLKVSYFWPFRKEYVIIDQGKDYEYSVVCTSDRKNLWIIARTHSIRNESYEKILNAIEKQGFHRDNLIKTEHHILNVIQPEKS